MQIHLNASANFCIYESHFTGLPAATVVVQTNTKSTLRLLHTELLKGVPEEPVWLRPCFAATVRNGGAYPLSKRYGPPDTVTFPNATQVDIIFRTSST
jgi:hypothetical protein